MAEKSHYERIVTPAFKEICEQVRADLSRANLEPYVDSVYKRLRYPRAHAFLGFTEQDLRDVAWGGVAFERVQSIIFKNDMQRYVMLNQQSSASTAAIIGVMYARAAGYEGGVCSNINVLNDKAFTGYMNEEYKLISRVMRARGVAHTMMSLDQYAHIFAFQMRVAQVLACFETNGSRTFKMSDGLAQRLFLTELRGVRGSDVQLPYKAIYIEVPEFLGFKLHNPETGEHKLTGAYVMEVEGHGKSSSRELFIMLCGAPNKASMSLSDDCVQYFKVELGDTLVINEVERAVEDAARDASLSYAVRTRDTENWSQIVNWIVNILFYITRPFADMIITDTNRDYVEIERKALAAPMGSNKRAKLYASLRGLTKQTRVVLGGTMTLDRSLPTNKDSLAAAMATTASGLRGPMSVQRFVKGHTQAYWTGPGRTVKRWIMKAPYFMGPEGAPMQIKNVMMDWTEKDEDEA